MTLVNVVTMRTLFVLLLLFIMMMWAVVAGGVNDDLVHVVVVRDDEFGGNGYVNAIMLPFEVLTLVTFFNGNNHHDDTMTSTDLTKMNGTKRKRDDNTNIRPCLSA